MKSFTLVSRLDENSSALAEKIENRLKEMGFEKKENQPDLCVVVGGDGTLLHAVQQHKDTLETTSFLGVHTGTLGFFTSYYEEEIDQFFSDIQQKKIKVQEVDLLEVSLSSHKEKFFALNDMRVENSSRTQKMEVFINDEKFETYHGTGLCISTQLGSTAYNRSIQGAVIAEGLSVLQLSEIAGIHHQKYRSLGSSLVLPSSSKITIESTNFEGALLCMDSQCISLGGDEKIECKKSAQKVRLAHSQKRNYLDRVRGLFI